MFAIAVGIVLDFIISLYKYQPIESGKSRKPPSHKNGGLRKVGLNFAFDVF